MTTSIVDGPLKACCLSFVAGKNTLGVVPVAGGLTSRIGHDTDPPGATIDDRSGPQAVAPNLAASGLSRDRCEDRGRGRDSPTIAGRAEWVIIGS